MPVVVYSNDLMAISTISGTAKQFGHPSLSVSTTADFVARAPADAHFVFLDLAVPDDVAELVAAIRSHAPYAKILAFGPHVDEDRLGAAATAGCDKVLSRGQLVRDLPVLLSGAAESS